MIGYIELTSLCQLKCPFCRTGGQRHNYPQVPRGIMNKDTFNNIMKKIPSISFIYFYNWGEPFLNPDVAWFCEQAVKVYKKKCELGSNMQKLDEIMAKDIVKSGVQHLLVSCDGASQETYEKYRIGGSLQKLIDNTKLLVTKRNELQAFTPRITFKMDVNKFNEHEIPIFDKFAKNSGADASSIVGLCAMTPEGNQLFDTFVSSDKKYDGRTRGLVTSCDAPNQRIAIDWNGEVYPCCNPSGLEVYSCGNINKQTFEEIEASERLTYIKRFCVKGDIEQNNLLIPCYSCFGKYPNEEAKKNDPYNKFLKE